MGTMRAVERRGGLDRRGIETLLDVLMEPSPASYVGLALKLYRERGWEFEAAWAQVMRSLPRTLPDLQAWRASLRAAKDSWRAAYEAGSGRGSGTKPPATLSSV